MRAMKCSLRSEQHIALAHVPSTPGRNVFVRPTICIENMYPAVTALIKGYSNK
jgi:hypothetical protein